MPSHSYPHAPILLVDDEAQFLQSGSFSLRSSGMNNILTCENSMDVMDLLEKRQPSVILLDILMPHLTGKELLPKIKGRYPSIPVIMLTALNEVDTAAFCMKNGAFDYLVKPIDKTRLVTSIRHALEYNEIASENIQLKKHLLSNELEKPEVFKNIITQNKQMHAIFQYIGQYRIVNKLCEYRSHYLVLL